MAIKWDDATVWRLRALWGEGHSTAEIGRRLHTTKNSVVGKASRLDLPARPSPITHNPDSYYARRLARPPAAPAITLPPLASVAAEIPIAIPRSAIAAPRLSRAIRTPVVVGPVPIERARAPTSRPYGRIVTRCWPIGEPGTREFHFCDVPSDPGRPYCQEHVKVAYVRVRDLRDQAPA